MTSPMHIVHLMASPFYGGPEKQMLGLARRMSGRFRTTFLTFAERGLSRPMMEEVQKSGIEGVTLKENAPHYLRSRAEIARELTERKADLLCCSGYKPDILGWWAARRLGIPVVGVAHGWTGATWKVRLYESLDRTILKRMDAVVCVSDAQAVKARKAGIPEARLVVIKNAVGDEAFESPRAERREELLRAFPRRPRLLVGAAGRLSPEKGFAVLVDAAKKVASQRDDVGFLILGDGPLRQPLTQKIHELSLQDRVVLLGFRKDLAHVLPNLDLGAMPSFTEGLPVVLLELFAAGVPAVATSVGGIPEVMTDGREGFLVKPNDPGAMADRLLSLLANETLRLEMADRARRRARDAFSFTHMTEQYEQLFERLIETRMRAQLAPA